MHVLTVLDHPVRTSFSAAIAERFMAGAEAAGHTTELADLHREGFDPRWTAVDAEGFTAANTPEDIAREQSRIQRCDALCLVFPLYWWGMPAMTKGWVDRVFSAGWAYDPAMLGNPEASLLRKRSGLILMPAGANMDDEGPGSYYALLKQAWIDGTFGYCGLSPRRLEALGGAEGSATRRQSLLERAFEAGRTLPPPTAD
ncbi:MAG: NAD(P)H-dependent oxidoreductase [Pseudomonadota bacterium]